MYRSTPHSTTGNTPAKSLFSVEIRNKLPEISVTQLDDEEMRDGTNT